jgi:uncharacterized protein YlxW (UPF0749 family)
MSTRDRPSGSMGLLDRIVDEALDPGYADARRRHENAPARPPSSSPRRRVSALHLGVAGALAAAGFLGALAVADARADEPEAAAARSALVDRVERTGVRADEEQRRVDALRTEVDALQGEALAQSKQGRARAAELAELELVAGAVPVEGPGVRVTVDDAPDLGVPTDSADLGKVQDRDLQVVVNGLWAAGAEAVSVGGYRLTSTTAIRTAGSTILVDFRPVLPPYSVEAIGDPRTLRAAFAEGPGGQTLQALSSRYGIRFETGSVDELELGAGVSLGVGDTEEDQP